MSATLHEADCLIIGGGPAGIAAARRLLAAGRTLIWVDNQAQPGGQIWRGGPSSQPSTLAQRWGKDLQALLLHPRLKLLPQHAVVAAEDAHTLLLENQRDASPCRVRAQQLLLATGARERFLPLPGWTLPGVTGAGGLQALVKAGWPIAGQRVVLAGSGPLLLASADTLRRAGAKVLAIAEQAPWSALGRFALGLSGIRLTQAIALRWRLRETRYLSAWWVQRALGETQLQAVELSNGRQRLQLECDALGLGFGLIPNTELAELLGCRIEAGAVAVDGRQCSSIPGVYAAGECCGIGGVDKALLEGELAAQAMLDQSTEALSKRLRPQHRFAAALKQHFALRPELLKLADARTVVCRCEDVNLGAVRAWPDWREAKLQTRCGMGACQGRQCGPITQSLLNWPARGLREPLQPTPLGCLLGDAAPDAAERLPDAQRKLA